MRTPIILVMISISSLLNAQIPEFNSDIKSNNAKTKGAVEESNIVATNRYEVPIPDDLVPDMISLMHISNSFIDASGAIQYSKLIDRELTKLYNIRNCTFIIGEINTEDCVECSYLEDKDYNDKMLKNSKSIEKYKRLQDFFETANALGGIPTVKRSFFPIRSVM